jgi:hypothetical protein
LALVDHSLQDLRELLHKRKREEEEDDEELEMESEDEGVE